MTDQKKELLALFGTLHFHIETLEDNERYAEEHPNSSFWKAAQVDADRLCAYRAKRDEIRAILCHSAPPAPELG